VVVLTYFTVPKHVRVQLTSNLAHHRLDIFTPIPILSLAQAILKMSDKLQFVAARRQAKACRSTTTS